MSKGRHFLYMEDPKTILIEGYQAIAASPLRPQCTHHIEPKRHRKTMNSQTGSSKKIDEQATKSQTFEKCKYTIIHLCHFNIQHFSIPLILNIFVFINTSRLKARIKF